MKITDEMLSKIELNPAQKAKAFEAACAQAGQQNKPRLADFAEEAVRALKTIEIQGKALS